MDDYYITKREAYEALRDKLAYSVCGPLLPSQAHLIAKIISDIPAADVAPVVHGEWVDARDDTYDYICSLCDTRFPAWLEDWDYCPNCGARMNGV